jgi:hypothetical protein
MFSSFKNFFIAVLLMVLLAGCTISIDLGTDSPPTDTPELPPPAASAPPATPEPTPLPVGWAIYRSEDEGFEIAYPTSYAPLDDSDNLYGWPNGLLLLYNAGQSYDIVVQVWDSVEEYESALGSDVSRAMVFPSEGRFFTVMDITQEPDNASVIATFRLTR